MKNIEHALNIYLPWKFRLAVQLTKWLSVLSTYDLSSLESVRRSGAAQRISASTTAFIFFCEERSRNSLGDSVLSSQNVFVCAGSGVR